MALPRRLRRHYPTPLALLRSAVLLLGLVGCGRALPEFRPSILLITLDTTRADRLGAYGYADAETPTYDRLAHEGMLFLRAYTAAPLTIPSHSTILTGLYPPSHGVRDNGDFVLSPDVLTLAERLRASGYTNAAFTSAFPTQARWGFDQGFDVYHDPLPRLPTQRDWSDQRRADQVVDDALATLPATGPGPLFVWVHLFDAHWPYDPPEPFRTRHAGRPYDGEIAFADAQVGRLLDWWDAAQPDSVVALVSDHGEAMGDGGEQTHGFLLSDGTLRVPLILRGSGVMSEVIPPASRWVQPVGTVDLVPTLLNLAGLPLDASLQGQDLREGGSARLFSEAMTGQYSLGLSPLFSLTTAEGRVTTGVWSGFYAATGGTISSDPAPDADLGPWEQGLQELMSSLEPRTAPEAALAPEDLAALEALGYVGGMTSAPAGQVDPRDVIDVIPLVWQARRERSAGRLDQARRMLDTLRARLPGTWGLDLLSAELLLREERWDEAESAYIELYLKMPSGSVALQLARLSAQRGDWLEAEDWFQEALDRQPASPEAMAGLVETAMAIGHWERALVLAESFLLAYPDHVPLVLMRAELLLREGRVAEANNEARYALDEMPYSPDAWRVAATAAWEAGEADRAIALLEQALLMDQGDLDTRLVLTGWLTEVGRRAEARRTLALVTRLMPDLPEGKALASALRAPSPPAATRRPPAEPR